MMNNRELRARIKKLEAALKPFAEFQRIRRGVSDTASPVSGKIFSICTVEGDTSITVENLKAALACFDEEKS